MSAILLALSSLIVVFFIIVFLIAAIPEGIISTLGRQITNTTLKSEEIVTLTPFYSSSTIIISVLMPLVGYIVSLSYLSLTTKLCIFA